MISTNRRDDWHQLPDGRFLTHRLVFPENSGSEKKGLGEKEPTRIRVNVENHLTFGPCSIIHDWIVQTWGLSESNFVWPALPVLMKLKVLNSLTQSSGFYCCKAIQSVWVWVCVCAGVCVSLYLTGESRYSIRVHIKRVITTNQLETVSIKNPGGLSLLYITPLMCWSVWACVSVCVYVQGPFAKICKGWTGISCHVLIPTFVRQSGGSSWFPTWRPGQLPLQTFILPPLVPLVPLVLLVLLVQFPPGQRNCGRVKTSAEQVVHVITLVSTRCDWTRWVIFYNPLLPGKHHYQGWNLSVTLLSAKIIYQPVNSCHVQFSHLILNYSMFAVPETI